ncbi:hypothetical protein CANCADRAFT_148212 [Tortispora caseinolytica NRRL Y-17796]|uniref:Major facilitator superfamily (MFS) profile domain-containing protein n=1 Tax=Tortispora caseinolytica NRRL Y-17796 TaxID=767744 RepID=A0A1E4THX6_9ASCO|nr:hypothetical protein CANCADRAFT_148212 [Tortispora caseinolytica NRRL Y-17796]
MVSDPQADLQVDQQANLSRIFRKLDLWILPMISSMYLMSFLDRTNVGYANVAGMSKDLGMTPHQYSIGLSVFFAAYVSLETPSNVFLKRLHPKYYLPSLTIAWGIITTLSCLVQNFGGFVTVRVLLGLAEAGLFPGMIFYLSMWYPRYKQLSRFSWFFSAASLSGAFGGLLGRGLVALDGRAGLEGWRWIFLVEGLLTVAVGCLAYFVLQDGPSTASFLTETERSALLAVLAADYKQESEDFDWKLVRSAFADWKVWLAALMCVSVAIPTFSFALFLPSIVASIGYSNVQAQLMSVPPFATACVFTALMGLLSDKWRYRTPFMLIYSTVGMIGYILLIALPHSQSGARYFATFLCAVSLYVCSAMNMGWLGNNLQGHHKRATGCGIQVSIGQVGGIVSSYLYPSTDAPKYIVGNSVALGTLAIAFITTVFMFAGLKYSNRRSPEDGFKYML